MPPIVSVTSKNQQPLSVSMEMLKIQFTFMNSYLTSVQKLESIFF